MVITGITIDGEHSYYRYGLRMLERNIGEPPKDDHTERVPYSNVTYDFDEIAGMPSYGERTISYQFEFLCRHKQKAQEKIILLRNWLHWSGRKNLYDPEYPDYHFEVREPSVNVSSSHGIYSISMTFKASPAMQPNGLAAFPVAPERFPDVDGDGIVSAEDAAVISAAAASIGAGGSSGLTEEQELKADADRDGEITAEDAALVLEFAGSAGAGKSENTPEGWTEFLNKKQGRIPEVY